MKILGSIEWFIKDYFSRHANKIDILLHVIGIPQALYGIFQLCSGSWKFGMLNFFLGYLWQWIGHKFFDKNEVGEIILIKSMIRKVIKKK